MKIFKTCLCAHICTIWKNRIKYHCLPKSLDIVPIDSLVWRGQRNVMSMVGSILLYFENKQPKQHSRKREIIIKVTKMAKSVDGCRVSVVQMNDD